MVEELRGVEGPEDIETGADAARFLDISIDSDEDEIDEAYTDLVLQVHPDQGGTTELFRAAGDAKELLEALSGGVAGGAGATQGASDASTDRGPAGAELGDIGDSAGATGSSRPGAGQKPDEDLVDSIEDMLRARMTEQELKQKYFQNTEFRDVAEILASLVLSGNIDLGSLERMVTGDTRFSSSVGSATGGTYSRGGGSNFGNSGYASSNPDDFMGYSSTPDDDDEDDDDDDGPRNARGTDFGGM